ncbi:MAG: hypothetical protein R3C40_10090 [Parvularculaceae bacterium]
MSAALARHDEAAISTNAVVARSRNGVFAPQCQGGRAFCFAGDAADGPALGDVDIPVADIAALTRPRVRRAV